MCRPITITAKIAEDVIFKKCLLLTQWSFWFLESILHLRKADIEQMSEYIWDKNKWTSNSGSNSGFSQRFKYCNSCKFWLLVSSEFISEEKLWSLGRRRGEMLEEIQEWREVGVRSQFTHDPHPFAYQPSKNGTRIKSYVYLRQLHWVVAIISEQIWQ